MTTFKGRTRLLVAVPIVAIMLSLASFMATAHVFAAPPAPPTPAQTCTKGSFFGLKPWWAFLPPSYFGDKNDPCSINCFNVWSVTDINPNTGKPGNDCGETASDIPRVLLAVIDDLLLIAGVVAVGFIIYAAFSFVTSQGNPEDAKKARGTAINALIGLLFSLVATALVSYIGRSIGG